MATSSNENASSGYSGFTATWTRGVRVGSRGLPTACRCGESSMIKTSGTVKNPGRLFYCCPMGSENDKYHLFKWVDESIVEEIDEMKKTFAKLEVETRICKEVVNDFEKEIEDMKVIVRGIEKKMEAMKTEYEGREKRVKEMVEEIRMLKNMLICGVVVVGCYYYFCA